MNPPPPLRHGSSNDAASEAELARLVEESRPIRGWTEAQRGRLLERIERRRGAPTMRWKWSLVFAAPALALLALAVLRFGADRHPDGSAPSTWSPVAVAAGRVEAHTGALLHRGAAIGSGAGEVIPLVLDSGELRGSDASAVVITSKLNVKVAGATFSLRVSGSQTTLVLEAGSAEVAAPGRATEVVSAPATIHSDDPRFVAPAPVVAAPAIIVAAESAADAADPKRACAEGSIDARRECLQRIASGSDLAAQNALFALALLERTATGGAGALDRFRSYQARFPDGVLAPESAAGVFAELVALHRDREAVDEGAAYLTRFPHDERAAEIALARAKLLREQLHQPERAIAAYQEALDAQPTAPLTEEALFAIGLCQRDLQRTAAMQATWSRYLARFPSGKHVAEIAAQRESAPAK